MEYTTLGSTGTTVSRLCLGCMSFGTSEWRNWVLDEDESREIIERAIDLGINFFDTANMYSMGESERVLGNVLDDYDRDSQVVATKGYFEMDEDNPNSGGLSRKTLEQELSNSLDRLGMDTVDLFQIHRWDYDTPIEVTLRTLDDAVRRGQVRYIGASSMWTYQFAEALHKSSHLGLERFATMQEHYSLAHREAERELLPLCEREEIGVIPWSPLGRGYLTRPHEDFSTTSRATTDQYARQIQEGAGSQAINERVQELAIQYGVSMAQIALAWLLHKDWVTAPIIGTTSVEHLEDAVEALDLSLSASEIAYLEEPYEPMEIMGQIE